MLPASGQARRGRACQTPPGSKDSNGKEVTLGAAGLLLGHIFYQITQLFHKNNSLAK